jgi:hypothetical protein
VIVAPVFLAAFIVVVPLSIFTELTGWGATVRRSRKEVATYIDDFINNRGGRWDWDDFTSVRIADPMLDEIRIRCIATHDDFPPDRRGVWCSPAGFAELQRILDALEEPLG